jgi:hypothetical protein
LILFEEVITVCSENHAKQINTICGRIAELVAVKSDGSLHIGFKGLNYCKAQFDLGSNSVLPTVLTHISAHYVKYTM